MTVAPELLLASHLKTLRLPTFLREHDKLGAFALPKVWTMSAIWPG